MPPPNPFATIRNAERWYARQLRGIAQQVQIIVHGMFGHEDTRLDQIEQTLQDYARLITPWAEAVAARMVGEVSRRDARAWFRHGREMGRLLHQEIVTAPTGRTMTDLMADQVGLIKSLPLQAAQRVHDLATGSLYGGERWEKISDEIWDTGLVTKSRANLIARTETSRAATSLTQARAEHIGSPGYWWRSTLDADTRPRHRQLNGKFILWSDPPVVSEPGQKEMKAHAGASPNCRCWPMPATDPEQAQVDRTFRTSPAFRRALRRRGYTTGAAFE
jgi:SPP1 gp7 family putative phage head morphogenesis protein